MEDAGGRSLEDAGSLQEHKHTVAALLHQDFLAAAALLEDASSWSGDVLRRHAETHLQKTRGDTETRRDRSH